MRHVNPSAKHLAHGKPAKIVDYYLFFFSCSGVVLHLPVHQSPMELKKKTYMLRFYPKPISQIFWNWSLGHVWKKTTGLLKHRRL